MLAPFLGMYDMAEKKKKEILFTVTAADCDWQYTRSSGKGGQNVNKVNSKVRCTHRASGAVGVAQDTRDQHQNKKLAFERMAKSKEFEKWHKVECARRLGKLRSIDETVDALMAPHNLQIEGKKDGRWTPIEECEQVE